MKENDSLGLEAVGDVLLDRHEVGRILGMSPSAISVAMCRNRFPLKPIRIGSRLRWRASAVRQYLDRESAVNQDGAR